MPRKTARRRSTPSIFLANGSVRRPPPALASFNRTLATRRQQRRMDHDLGVPTWHYLCRRFPIDSKLKKSWSLLLRYRRSRLGRVSQSIHPRRGNRRHGYRRGNERSGMAPACALARWLARARRAGYLSGERQRAASTRARRIARRARLAAAGAAPPPLICQCRNPYLEIERTTCRVQ